MEKIKLLHIFPIFKQGGVPIVVNSIANGINGHIHQCFCAKFYDKEIIERYKHLGETFDLDTHKASLITAYKLLKLIKLKKIELIHGHGKAGLFYGIFIKIFLKKVKVVHTFHGFIKPNSFLLKLLYLIATKLFSGFITLSNSEKEAVELEIPKISHKITTIGNPISKPLPQINTSIMECTNKADRNFVTFSRFDPQKDILKLLVCFQNYISNSVELTQLHIFGGFIDRHKSYYDSIIKFLSQNPALKECVILWGEVDGASSYLHYFDLYVSSSRWEGLPTAIIEAMQSCIPVLCTSVQGNKDLIEQLKTGLIFDNDITFTNNIKKLFNEPVLEEQLKISAFKFSVQFNPSIICSKYVEYYKSI